MCFTSNLYAQLVNNIRLLGNQNNIEVYYDFHGDDNTVLDIVGFEISSNHKCNCTQMEREKINIPINQLKGHLVSVNPFIDRSITLTYDSSLFSNFDLKDKYFVDLKYIIHRSNHEQIKKVNNIEQGKELEDVHKVVDFKKVNEVETPEPVVDFPDVEAEFTGGETAIARWMQQNLVYPEMSMEMGEQGKVYLKFVVEKDGSITNVQIIKGVSCDLNCEAMRLVINMPNWKPAEINGMKVRSLFILPINFELN